MPDMNDADRIAFNTIEDLKFIAANDLRSYASR